MTFSPECLANLQIHLLIRVADHVAKQFLKQHGKRRIGRQKIVGWAGSSAEILSRSRGLFLH